MNDKKCLHCGISRRDAYTTYDGYYSSRVERKCGRWVSKCDSPICASCTLLGGHEFVKLGTRHRWGIKYEL